MGIRLKGFVIHKLLNNPLAFSSLTNLDFLLSHTAHFDKIIILPFFVLIAFRFLLFIFFSNNRIILYINTLKSLINCSGF